MSKKNETAETTAETQIEELKTQLKDAETLAENRKAEIEALEDLIKSMGEAEEQPENTRFLAEGSTFWLADELVTLRSDALISFTNVHSEAKFAAMLAMSENLDANRESLKFKYDGRGHVLPLEEQVEDASEIPALLVSLEREEANLFGALSLWEDAQKAAKADEKAAEKSE